MFWYEYLSKSKKLNEYSLKEGKISIVVTKTIQNSIPTTKFYEKWSHLTKNLNDLGHLSKVTKVKSSSRYSNIFVRFLRVLEYILDIKARYLYSNIRCSAGNIWVFKYISRVPIATRLKTTKLILLDSLPQ